MPRNKFKELRHVDPESEDYKKAVDELVEIVRTVPDNRTYKLDDEIQNFIEDIHIKTGTCGVPAFIIYYEYLLWEGITDVGDDPKFMYEEFFRRFSTKFNSSRKNTGKSYRLNKDTFGKYNDMTNERILEIKEFSLHFQVRNSGNKPTIEHRINYRARKKEEKEAKRLKEATSILKEEEESGEEE